MASYEERKKMLGTLFPGFGDLLDTVDGTKHRVSKEENNSVKEDKMANAESVESKDDAEEVVIELSGDVLDVGDIPRATVKNPHTMARENPTTFITRTQSKDIVSPLYDVHQVIDVPIVNAVSDNSKKKLSIKEVLTPAIEYFEVDEKPLKEREKEVIAESLIEDNKSLASEENSEFFKKYSFLKTIEDIGNKNGYSIVFTPLIKDGLFMMNVYINDTMVPEKSCVIDAGGCFYDQRAKFIAVPGCIPENGKSYEDYPAYLIYKGGKDQVWDFGNIEKLIIGGISALPKYSAYTNQFYNLNKVVDLSTFPRFGMRTDIRKSIISMLISVLEKPEKENPFYATWGAINKQYRYRFTGSITVRKNGSFKFKLTTDKADYRLGIPNNLDACYELMVDSQDKSITFNEK